MPEMLSLLIHSRKAFIAFLTIGSVTLVTVVGVVKNVPEQNILGLVGAITGIAWKLIGSIASEDNAQRALAAAALTARKDGEGAPCDAHPGTGD